MTDTHQFELSFIAVGPQRTGTTWLHQVMENHSSIGLPSDIKETMFFDKYYHNGSNWLYSHYENSNGSRILGEIAPTYFGSDTALERIKSDHPDCKILINVRNPVDHAYSMYLHEVSKGRIQESLTDVIRDNPEKIRPGLYAEWIPRWQAKFGEENVCLIWLDQIKREPRIVHNIVCDFLSVSTNHYQQSVGDRQVNASKKTRFPKLTKFGVAVYHLLREYRLHSVINFCKCIHLDKITFAMDNNKKNSQLSLTEHRALVDLYSDDIDFLEKISGQELSTWREHDS